MLLTALASIALPALPARADGTIDAAIGNYRGDRTTCSARIALKGLAPNTNVVVATLVNGSSNTIYAYLTTNDRGSVSLAGGGSFPSNTYASPNVVLFLVTAPGGGPYLATTTATNRCQGPRP